MNNAETHCLNLIEAGLLRLRDDGDVEIWHSSYQRWFIKKPRQVKRISYQFKVGQRVNTVLRNRLVWLLTHKRAIPDGFVVDHKDENRLNDTPGNLQLMPIGESHSQGNRIQSNGIFDYLSRWFQFLGSYGREPLTELELLYVNTGF